MVRRDRDRDVGAQEAPRIRRRVADEERAAREQDRGDRRAGERSQAFRRRVRDVIGGARVRARGERRRADVVELVRVQREREPGVARGLRERPHVVGVEDAVLDERIDRLGQTLVRDGSDGLRRVAHEPAPIIRARAGERVQREIRDGDVDRRRLRGRRDHAQLAKLLARLEPVPALHLDRGRAERDRAREPPPQQREQVVVAGLARRAHRRVDTAAALENGEVVRAALARDELVPSLARVAEMRVGIDESRHDHAPLGIDLASIRRALQVLP